MHAILAEFGLPYVYPKAVETAADKIPAEITPEEIARREDFRKVTTFTIDPKDAKDFDDALSIRPIKDGLWEVGVHIAERDTLRKRRRHHRQGSREAGDFRLSGRPDHPHASRTAM